MKRMNIYQIAKIASDLGSMDKPSEYWTSREEEREYHNNVAFWLLQSALWDETSKPDNKESEWTE